MRYKFTMNALEMVKNLEARARAVGLGTNALCKLAGIYPSTFNRWKAGDTSPTMGKIAKVEAVVTALECEAAPVEDPQPMDAG